MSLAWLITLTLVVSGFTMGALVLAFRSPWSANRRIREETGRKLRGAPVALRIGLNSIFSGGLVYVFALGLYRHLFYQAPITAGRFVYECVAVLAIYDFLYYFLHRYPFHQWPRLREVHTVHHKAKYPVAFDSLYLNPVETFLGLALLTFTTWLVGPVHVYSYAATFFVYSQMNILVHCGIDLPSPLRAFAYMARKHDRHHESMKAGNFASITPLWDMILGTAEEGGRDGRSVAGERA